MENTEVEKTMAFVNRDMIGYETNTIIYRTIIKKLTGSISLLSFDTGQGLPEKTSPFDTFVQVIDGRAEIVIDGTLYLLDAGQSIVIPAHRANIVRAKERFKMISTTIKSGYE